jgi:hypothetical protein
MESSICCLAISIYAGGPNFEWWDQISIEAVERDMDGDDRTLGDATVLTAGRTDSPIGGRATLRRSSTGNKGSTKQWRSPLLPSAASLPHHRRRHCRPDLPTSTHIFIGAPASAGLSPPRPQPRLRSPFPPPYVHSTPRPCELKPQPTPHALTLWSRRRTWSGGSTSCCARCRRHGADLRRGPTSEWPSRRLSYVREIHPLYSADRPTFAVGRRGGGAWIDFLCPVGCAVQVSVEELGAGEGTPLDLAALDGTWRLCYTSASDVLVLFEAAERLPLLQVFLSLH